MGYLERIRHTIEGLPGTRQVLEDMLVSMSGLPSPRANLELAEVVAKKLGLSESDETGGGVLWEWLRLDADQAPTNDPREFLPFCAIQALGYRFAGGASSARRQICEAIVHAVHDRRWRMREGAAISMRHIGEADWGILKGVIDEWFGGDDPMGERAVLVSIAHGPVLKAKQARAYALQRGGEALGMFAAKPEEIRRQAPWQALRKGLEFVLSVYVAAEPEDGFVLLRKWADHEDLEVRKIVWANLRKARLAKRFPDQLSDLADRLSSI